LVEQFVLQQPVGGRRLAEHAQLERLELRRFEPQQGFWRRDAVEAPALHIRENISRAVVGLRNGRELEADRQPDDEVARESVGVRIAPAQRVADEAHALGKPRVFQLPSQLAREQLGDLVLEAFARPVGKRQVVRVLAHAQHAIGAHRLGRLAESAARSEQNRDDSGKAQRQLHFSSSSRPGWIAPSERPLR
jgi:hypothetical protein